MAIKIISTTCPEANIINSGSTYSASAPAGHTFILPNIQLSGNSQYITDYPSVDNINLNIFNGINQIGSPSGTSWYVTATTITNSGSSYNQNVPAESGFTLPNITHIDSNLSGVTLPAQTPFTATTCDQVSIINSGSTYTATTAAGSTFILPNVTNIDSDGSSVLTPAQTPFTASTCISRAWVRNPDWLAMPDLSDGDNIFYILNAVKSGVNNFFAFKTETTSGDYTVDLYNDGTTVTTHASNVQSNFDLDYSKGTNEVTANGDNYKQIITKITANFKEPTLNIVHSGSSNGMATRVLSVKIASQTMDNIQNCFSSFSNAYHTMLEDFEFVGTCNVTNFKNTFYGCRSLGSVVGNFSGCTGWQGTFKFAEGVSLDNMTTGGGFFRQTFNAARIESVFNQNFLKNATDFNQTFSSASFLRYVGTPTTPIDMTGANVYSESFRNALSLRHAYFQNATPTNLDRTFYGCALIQTISGLDCTNVTSFNNAFFNNFSLSTLEISNMKISFSIENCNFNRAGLVNVFTDLYDLTTIPSTATITIIDNPGVADLTSDDEDIATDKGWTIVKT